MFTVCEVVLSEGWAKSRFLFVGVFSSEEKAYKAIAEVQKEREKSGDEFYLDDFKIFPTKLDERTKDHD